MIAAKLDLQAAEIAALRERVAVLEAQASGAAQGSEFELVSTAPPLPKASGSQVLSSSGISEERGVRLLVALGWGVAHEIRGPSGRDQINLPSKLYIEVRDVHLKAHSPPLIFLTWAEAKSFCVVRGQPSESIFIGLPSQEEARVALAGFEFPAALRR